MPVKAFMPQEFVKKLRPMFDPTKHFCLRAGHSTGGHIDGFTDLHCRFFVFEPLSFSVPKPFSFSLSDEWLNPQTRYQPGLRQGLLAGLCSSWLEGE